MYTYTQIHTHVRSKSVYLEHQKSHSTRWSTVTLSVTKQDFRCYIDCVRKGRTGSNMVNSASTAQ